MNKKTGIIIACVVLVAIVLGVIICITKGGKLDTIKLPLQIDVLERTVSVEVGYPKNKGIAVEDTDWENRKTIKNEKNNYSIEFSLAEDSTYKDNKEYYSEEEGYEEIKIGDYSGYIVKGTYYYEGGILLEDLEDQNIFVYLTIELSALDSYKDDKEVDIATLYELPEVQKILKSIKYNKGEETKEETKNNIAKKEEEEATSNYGEFKDKARTEGTSDKEGLIFIPSYDSPDKSLYKAEQRNDNVGIDNYLWYIAEESSFDSSGIEVRIFPKTDDYESIEEYKEEKGDMYHWAKTTIAGTEYDTYTFGTDTKVPDKYSKYYSGAFMHGNKIIEFSYNMYEEVPDQDLGDTFFKQIMESIEYAEDYK